jgi:poly(U)-binding-splicing factor PUF60
LNGVFLPGFCDFFCLAETEAAAAALDGRFFAGRSIIAKVYDQELYDANDLSG